MFLHDDDADKKAAKVLEKLGSHKNTKTHNRHISATEAKRIGLKITSLEKNQNLQDAVLGLHHCYMMTFSRAKVIKIFESSHGRSFSFNG